MDNMIFIDHLNFQYKKNIIFKNLSMSIRKGSFTTILGNNGCGKTTLVRLLTGLESSNCIFIGGKLLSQGSLNSIRRQIGVVFENPDDCLVSDTVIGDLAFPLENLDYSSEYVYSHINEISSYLGISHLLERNPKTLSYGEKQLVCLGCAFITGPSLIILDEALCALDDASRFNILKFLRKINKDFGTTILNITHDIEESIYGDDILIIDRDVLIHDKKEVVYKQEKLLRNNGFDLPFMVNLSNKLSYYDMVDSVVYDMDEMVDLLWK